MLRLRLLRVWLTHRQPLLLFVRFGGIGDILCSLPAYAALCRAHPNAHGVFITLAEFQCLPQLAQAPGTLCASRVHCSIPNFPRSLVAQIFQPQYTDEIGRQNSTAHLVDEFYHACGLQPAGDSPRFKINSAQRDALGKLFQLPSASGAKIVVIHPGPSWKVREWPVAHWQALVDGLHAAGSVRILQIGAHRHVTLGATEAATLHGVESLVGKLSLTEMAALLTLTDLFIGIDSGMIHMAGAAGTPCVGIFGPTNPAYRIFPSPHAVGLFHTLPCSFCHHRQPRLHWQSGCPNDIACMKQLAPATVLAESLRQLNLAGATTR